MQPLDRFEDSRRRQIRFVLSDVDDTLTDGPLLPAPAYQAIARLEAAGITVIPVTAAPAGWCDLMARMWPVGAVIGENGGLCFRHDRTTGETLRRYWAEAAERAAAAARLAALAGEIVAALAHAEIAHDQRYREVTLAFRNRDPATSDMIQSRLAARGAKTTLNSIWVLAWFGEFDKLAMARRMMAELFATDIDRDPESCLYIGDSLNDAPMFAHFRNSVGVSSVRRYADRLPVLPCWITRGAGGAGFVEMADRLLGG